jgi:hypothetical protein
MATSHFQLINDPPDPNFRQVAQYSHARPVHDFGLGVEVNERFATFLASLIRATEAVAFALASLERLQGAIEAGDLEAADRQRLAYELFASDIGKAEAEAGRQVAALRAFLAAQGVSDNAALEVLTHAANVLEATDDLQPVPEPTTLLLVGTTMVGLGLAGWRQRRRNQQAE